MKNRGIGCGRIILSAIFMAFSLFVFTGCIANNFTKEEEEAFLKEAEKVAAEQLSEIYSGAEVTKIESRTAVEDDKYALTEFAGGRFVWQNRHYDFVVNTETGEIYTSACFHEIRKRLKEEVFRGLSIDCYESAVVGCYIRYLTSCERVGVQIAFDNVFPAEESADELFRKILENEEEYSFSMTVQYKGEDIPWESMEEIPPFPTLSGVNIYHIAEEHELCAGDYISPNLPRLSSEILERSFRDDTAKYVKNRTLERDGFQIVYNAYKRIREQDEVKEAVIDVEDILFMVAEDYLDLSCTKDNYVMYLSTTDEELAGKYCYAYDSYFDKEKTQRVTWYPYEGDYVYAGVCFGKEETPHKFCNRDPEENTIYSREQTLLAEQ